MIGLGRFSESFKSGLVDSDLIKLGKVLPRFVRMLSHALKDETNNGTSIKGYNIS